MNKFKLEEKSIYQLIKDINAKKLVFIDRKKNKQFKNNYKDIIYRLNISNYRYSSIDDNKKYQGEKVHIFSYDNLYVKVKITGKICKILSLHVARYEL